MKYVLRLYPEKP